jgi:hypothetical protein
VRNLVARHKGVGTENNMGLINLKTIRSVSLFILMTLGSATPTLVTRYSVSLAQGRGQLAQASRNYELGVQAGRQDARRNLSNDYQRHRREFGGNRISGKVTRMDTKIDSAVDTPIGAMNRDLTGMVTMATMIGVLLNRTAMAEGHMVMRLLAR